MEETRKSSQGVHVWLPARQVLVRAKPNALASRSCHLMSAILRVYICVATFGDSCYLLTVSGCNR